MKGEPEFFGGIARIPNFAENRLVLWVNMVDPPYVPLGWQEDWRLKLYSERKYVMAKLGRLEPDGYVNLGHRDLMTGVTLLLFSVVVALWNWMWGFIVAGKIRQLGG